MADPSTTDGASQAPGYYFGCDDTTPSAQRTHKVDCNWPGRSRKVTKSPRGGGGTTTPDYFGIYIKAKHETITGIRSEEHTSELQSLMRLSYAVFCLTKKK